MFNMLPKYLRNIENELEVKLKQLKQSTSEILDKKQIYYDEVLKVYNCMKKFNSCFVFNFIIKYF